jgi:hypothetical protein
MILDKKRNRYDDLVFSIEYKHTHTHTHTHTQHLGVADPFYGPIVNDKVNKYICYIQ